MLAAASSAACMDRCIPEASPLLIPLAPAVPLSDSIPVAPPVPADDAFPVMAAAPESKNDDAVTEESSSMLMDLSNALTMMANKVTLRFLPFSSCDHVKTFRHSLDLFMYCAQKPSSPLKRPAPVETDFAAQIVSAKLRKVEPRKKETVEPAVKCYTRNIPDAENMTFAQLVKVAARVKLRKTQIPR